MTVVSIRLGEIVACFSRGKVSGSGAEEDAMVLVVEDEKLQSWSLAESLTKWGFEVRSAFTGNDALALIERSAYDVILLDYQLPDLDGLQVARRVRQIRPGTLIFLVSAFQLNELPVHSGLIDAYFNKPLDLQQLHQALAKFAGGRKQQEAGALLHVLTN
jgi:CheY-like chemotaxis protein